MWHELDHNHIALVMLTAWEIQKSRCSHPYSGDLIQPNTTLQSVWAHANSVRYSSYVISLPRLDICMSSIRDPPTGSFTCYIDGSYQAPLSGGTGYILFHEGILVKFEGKGYDRPFSTFHMNVWVYSEQSRQWWPKASCIVHFSATLMFWYTQSCSPKHRYVFSGRHMSRPCKFGLLSLHPGLIGQGFTSLTMWVSHVLSLHPRWSIVKLTAVSECFFQFVSANYFEVAVL